LSGIRVEDAGSAQMAVKRYLASQFGEKKVKDVRFSRAWYTPGSQKDVWEVEGDVVLQKGLFGKEELHFKFQIDPGTGRVIAYEI